MLRNVAGAGGSGGKSPGLLLDCGAGVCARAIPLALHATDDKATNVRKMLRTQWNPVFVFKYGSDLRAREGANPSSTPQGSVTYLSQSAVRADMLHQR